MNRVGFNLKCQGVAHGAGGCAASGKVSVGLGWWSQYTFLPGSYQWECECIIPSDGWDYPSLGSILAVTPIFIGCYYTK